MEQLPRPPSGRGQALDHITEAYTVRVTRCREHHAEGRTRIPLRRDRVQPARQRRLAQFRQVRTQPRQDWLRLWIAQATVELEYLGGALGIDHEPGVEETGVRCSVGGQAA